MLFFRRSGCRVPVVSCRRVPCAVVVAVLCVVREDPAKDPNRVFRPNVLNNETMRLIRY